MPLELNDLVNNISSKLIDTESSVLNNPFVIAVLIVLIILIIVYFVIKDEIEIVYEDASIWTLLIKIGVWSFIATSGIAFLHNKVISAKYENKNKDTSKERVVGVATDINITDKAAIAPNT